MKHLYLIVLTAVILMIGVRADAALSSEALTAIEEMRARVELAEQQAALADTDDGKYIPGRELSAVLARYRNQIYGSQQEADETLANWRVSVPESKVVSDNGYQPGSMLAKALDNYRAQRKVFSIVKVMKAKEATGRVEHTHEVMSGYDESSIKSDFSRQEAGAFSSPGSDKLLDSSALALETSGKSIGASAKARANASIVSAHTDADVDASIGQNAADLDSDNKELQKYEYKMPKNYRIIVK